MSATPFLDKVREIEAAKNDIDIAIGDLLRERGWDYACNTPGSFWFWQKQMPDGRIVLASKETALLIEMHTCGEGYLEGGIEL